MRGKKVSDSILAVDDEETNLLLLESIFEDEGYEVDRAKSGKEALIALTRRPDKYCAILLDRMMPEIDGLEVLKMIKKNPTVKKIPVIIQTALSDKNEIVEGLKAGAYYYVTKPFLSESMLVAIVKSAVKQFKSSNQDVEKISKIEETIRLITEGMFCFCTPKEADNLAFLLSKFCPEPDTAVVGLAELLFNAIEHGNLGITYNEKKALVSKGGFDEQVSRRLTLPENRSKKGTIKIIRSENEVKFFIKDAGLGFDWQNFMNYSPDRAFDPNGRGIAIARNDCFTSLEYIGCGNEVHATIKF
jgi:CheY-like chemotaxis protein